MRRVKGRNTIDGREGGGLELRLTSGTLTVTVHSLVIIEALQYIEAAVPEKLRN